MKILIIGSGAREHVIAWKLAGERNVSEVICAPGNVGAAAIARCLPVNIEDPVALLALAKQEQVDLTVVGPELPLSRGVSNLFQSQGHTIVGPTSEAAALESSKAFAKEFMARHGIATARFKLCTSLEQALHAVENNTLGYPLVVKADGLAAGKGVVIAENRDVAESAIRAAMVEQRFGSAGSLLVLEEFLVGKEVSYFVLVDGVNVMPLGSAQDHKRIFDGDEGPNTGGMGAFAPSPLVSSELEQLILNDIVYPVVTGMNDEGYPYSGFLYVGLMLTVSGPKVVEFNVRFGDPEAQVLFPMLSEDLSPLLVSAATGHLPSRPARINHEPHVGVVLAASGYPGAYERGIPIEGLDEASAVPGALLFHAGTGTKDGRIVTNGGRILTVVGHGLTYRDAIDVAYSATDLVRFKGMHYRRDIGSKALASC